MRDKLYVGPKIRSLREGRNLRLEACAKELGLSTSYLSQIETNQRPVTARVLIALSRYFGINPGEFDTDDESRLIADLREATADLALDAASPALSELKLAAAATPTLARQFLALHRAYRALDERMLRFDETVKIRTEDAPDSLIPYQEVRDFFHYRDNYVDELDVAAEAIAAEIGVGGDADVVAVFERALAERFDIRVVRAPSPDAGYIRRYDPATRVVSLGRDLAEPTRAFQLATQLCDLLFGPLFDQVLASAGLKATAARDIARIGLGNYAAGALMMPYRQFAASAMALRHDIEQLQHRYTASFEQVSHRLSTLQRPGARGVPFTSCASTRPATSPSATAPRGSSSRASAAHARSGTCTRHSATRATSSCSSPKCPTACGTSASAAASSSGLACTCSRIVTTRSGSAARSRTRTRSSTRRGCGSTAPRCPWASAAASASGPTVTSAHFRRWGASSPWSPTCDGSFPIRSSRRK